MSSVGDDEMSSVGDNVRRVRDRIAAACYRVGREPDGVALVVVTKTVGPERIQEAVDAGVSILGENRVQEAASKIGAVSGEVAWHMVGHLQRNKVRKAVEMFDMVQSVDSFRLAREIDARCNQIGKIMEVLVEVNTSGEDTKYGVRAEDVVDLVEEMSHLKHVAVRGLMTIGAFTDDHSVVRGCFKALSDLAGRTQEAHIPGVEMRFLSMGMTSDFEIAIEEGSNMVRVGTAVFGPR